MIQTQGIPTPRRPLTILEACVDSTESAIIAADAGADRVELCADLIEGGTTPSAGSVAAAVNNVDADVMVMIRPRGGDFVYNQRELDIMRRDAEIAGELGATGVTLGCLTVDGNIDGNATRPLVEAARPMTVTFHRAFDVSRDPFESLKHLVQLGIDRLLTSGQQPSAIQGLDLIGELVAHAADQIIVMPGVGINSGNIIKVAMTTGAREFHIYTERRRASTMRFRRGDIPMGRSYEPNEYVVCEPDAAEIKAVAQVLHRSLTG